jgi:hypothetical protein
VFSLLRYPDQSVLPILEVRHDGTPEAFLGTGFIVAPVAALVTAVMSSPVVRQPRTVFLLLRSRHTMPGTGNFDQFTIYSCRRQQTWRSLSFEALMVYGRSLLPVVARLPRMSMYLLWTTAQLNFRWIKKADEWFAFLPGR